MNTKEEFRRLFRARRNSLTEEVLKDYSHRVCFHFEKFFGKHKAWQHIHVFIPMPNQKELNIFPIIEFLWSQDCIVYTSKMNYEDDQMDTVLFPLGSEIVLDKKSIPYPNDFSIVSPGSIQLVLVPLLACDLMGNRLGYGKGYYDKFFSSIQASQIFKLGISIFEPIECLPTESHDIRLNGCVYPGGILYF